VHIPYTENHIAVGTVSELEPVNRAGTTSYGRRTAVGDPRSRTAKAIGLRPRKTTTIMPPGGASGLDQICAGDAFLICAPGITHGRAHQIREITSPCFKETPALLFFIPRRFLRRKRMLSVTSLVQIRDCERSTVNRRRIQST